MIAAFSKQRANQQEVKDIKTVKKFEKMKTRLLSQKYDNFLKKFRK